MLPRSAPKRDCVGTSGLELGVSKTREDPKVESQLLESLFGRYKGPLIHENPNLVPCSRQLIASLVQVQRCSHTGA